MKTLLKVLLNERCQMYGLNKFTVYSRLKHLNFTIKQIDSLLLSGCFSEHYTYITFNL